MTFRRASRRVFFVATIGLIAVGCGELKNLPTSPDDPIDPTATLTRVQNEIFTPSCTSIGCHDAIGQQQGLVLTAGNSHAMLVGRPSSQVPTLQRVAPGDPLNSYIYRKVVGGSIVGEQMPLGGPRLSDNRIRLLRDWIRRGAPND